MASSSSSSSKKKNGGYRLVQLQIENFKSIKTAVIKINAGMTCITGANGVGKSNILEAIAFGLGAPLTSLRSQTLSDLAHATDSKMQIVVQLTFNQTKDVKIIGSSIINGQRIYHINENKKLVTKQVQQTHISTPYEENELNLPFSFCSLCSCFFKLQVNWVFPKIPMHGTFLNVL